MNLLVPFGTRPEIIKLAPVVAALRERGLTVRTVATGQHYDRSMAGQFFADLDLRPDEVWELPDSEPDRVGSILGLAFAEIAARPPDAVVCLGDTYTVPMFCLAARRRSVPVVHLEAGLRSFNPTSMEEVNRKVAAATAALHLAPTELAASFLLREGVPDERIRVVGNPVIDVLRTSGIRPRPPEDRTGVVVTAHRASNVDDPVRRQALVRLLLGLADRVGPVRFPIHPRTRALLERDGALEGLTAAGIELLDPLPYESMLQLLASSKVAVTDSGGLQEEASWLGLPVVVLRRSTPRWEGVRAGTAVLTGMDADRALEATVRLCDRAEQQRVAAMPCPYGDGHTGERVADLLADPDVAELLSIREPDFVGVDAPC